MKFLNIFPILSVTAVGSKNINQTEECEKVDKADCKGWFFCLYLAKNSFNFRVQCMLVSVVLKGVVSCFWDIFKILKKLEPRKTVYFF